MKRLFEESDLNKDNTLSFREFVFATPMKSALSKQVVKQQLFDLMDKNQDGKIDFREWLIAYYPSRRKSEIDTLMGWACAEEKRQETIRSAEKREKDIEEATGIFSAFDLNSDGVLCLNDLTQNGFSEEEARELLEVYDTDKSGDLTLEEFLTYFTKEYLEQATVDYANSLIELVHRE